MIHDKKISLGAMFAKTNNYEDKDGKKFEADLKDGDIVKFLESAKEIDGKFGKQISVMTETRNGNRVVSLNTTSVNNLVDAFGNDDKEWIGKKIKVWIIKALVSGKMRNIAYLSHSEAEMSEDENGKMIFLTPEKSNASVTSSDENGETITFDELADENK